MSTMKCTSDVWWRDGYDKVALGFYIAVLGELGLMKAFLFPPIIPCRLDNRGYVGFVVCIVQRLQYCWIYSLVSVPVAEHGERTLLLASWCLLHIRWQNILLFLALLLFRLCSGCGSSVCSFRLCLFRCELCSFLGFGPLFGNYNGQKTVRTDSWVIGAS